MRKFFIFFIVVSSALLFSCKKEIPYDFTDTKDNVVIYMPQAARGANNTFTVSVAKPFPDEPDSLSFVFGAYYAGNQASPAAIDATFEVDYSMLDSINNIEALNGRPPFEQVPDSVLSIPSLQTRIMSGKRSSGALAFYINARKIQMGSKYILPIRLKSVSGGYHIKPDLAITYFVLNVSDPIAGTYSCTGTRTLYSADGSVYWSSYTYTVDKTITSVSGTDYSMNIINDQHVPDPPVILSINDDFSVTISGGGWNAYPPGKTYNYGDPSTFDRSNRTFTLNYRSTILDGGLYFETTEVLTKK